MFFLAQQPKNEYADDFLFQHLKSHRIEVGESFWATDFKGMSYKCLLKTWDKKKELAQYSILEEVSKSSSLKHILVQAIPDKNYLDKLIEAATLAGFQKIILFESKFSPKYNLNLDRIQKICIQAALLAEFSFLPQIEILPLNKLIEAENTIKNSIILSQHGSLIQDYGKPKTESEIKNIWVGPEGGWHKSENELFDDLKIQKISLATGVIYPAWFAGTVWRLKMS